MPPKDLAMNRAPAIADNENLTICRECGGACCRTKPGIDSPDRYLSAANPAEALSADLASGKWVLDRHYGLPPEGDRPAVPAADLTLFYPRPAVRGETQDGSCFGKTMTGECALLGEEGCLLTFAERPVMCRALTPDLRFDCVTTWDRRHAALAWYGYQGIVRDALTRLGVPLPDDMQQL